MAAGLIDKIETHVPVGKPGRRIPIKVVAGVVAGNAMEFYDFIAYSFFAVYIGKAFFPAKTAFVSLLLSVGLFGVGFVFRPLGGIVIGAYADRAGRRSAMLLTIVLITFGTLGLALTPSYQSIGIAAPLLLIFCRLVQGFALGGEVGPATAFLVEIAPPGARGLYSSWQLAAQGLAALVAAAIGMAITLGLGPEALAAWGWRVPFLLCLVLIPLAFYLRRSMPETITRDHSETRAARDRIGAHKKVLALAVLLVLGGTVSTYVGQYMTTYAIATLNLPASIALFATVVGGLTTAIFALSGGWLSDRAGRRPIMLIPRILLAVLTWPAFWLLSTQPSATILYLVTFMLSALTAISGVASFVLIAELLPQAVRSTGMSIAYAIGVSLFGGTTQFIITWLIGVTGDPVSPAWYVTLTSVVTVAAMLALPETRGRELEG
jgi:MFS family permease